MGLFLISPIMKRTQNRMTITQEVSYCVDNRNSGNSACHGHSGVDNQIYRLFQPEQGTVTKGLRGGSH
jgi:hypothetical protein